MKTTTIILLGILISLGGLAAETHRGLARADEPTAASGIAAKYQSDRGIAKDDDVIFADDFESWQAGGTQPPRDTWRVRKNKVSRTRAIPGTTKLGDAIGPGDNILEIACWTPGSGSQSGGMSLRLGNYDHAKQELGDGYDELFMRYYVKFDDGYRAVRNHGGNLGGRDVTIKNAAWVGMAGIRDVSSRGYFYSGVQPRGKSGGRELEMGFYSYHLDKRGRWGENYDVRRRVVIKPGSWHCVERHMKLNSVDPKKDDPALADGLEELWIDGQLTIRKQGVRFRRAAHLKIAFSSLDNYYHGLPKNYDQEHPIRVFFDNLVIAKKYIGPIGSKSK